MRPFANHSSTVPRRSLASLDFSCPSLDQSTEEMRANDPVDCCCRISCIARSCSSAYAVCRSELQCTSVRRSGSWATLKRAPQWWIQAPGLQQCMDLETDFGSRKEDRQPMLKAWKKHHCDDFTHGNQLTISRNHKLIYDIGFHSGEDSLYFLKRGYDVVAVDANPSLIEDGLSRPVMQLARLSGQFHALARGIAGRAAQENQTLTFYVHRRVTEWSTFVPPSGRREDFSAITVPITTCGDLIHQFGTPYYMKVLRSASTPSPLLRRCRVPLTHGNT